VVKDVKQKKDVLKGIQDEVELSRSIAAPQPEKKDSGNEPSAPPQS
jgi:hypothetical protein